ncbi:hypothetical protein EDB83DRAFT_2344854 [Lactarius deliciosus]|nr:hypothetical protein EDB83DRAFT_2344854 [Lactarius deliciosus]
MNGIVPRLHAQLSPEDKRILAETLKELGDVVGTVTGEGDASGLTLKTLLKTTRLLTWR